MNQPNQYCNKCGALLAPDARFCENCGQPVINQAGDRARVSPGRVPLQRGNRPTSRNWLLFGLAGAGLLAFLSCVLVAGFAVFRMMQAKGDSTQASSPPPVTQAAILPASPTAERQPATAIPEATTPTPLLPEPAASDTPLPATSEAQLTQYDFDGVTFSYDPSLAAAVDPETVGAQTGNDLPPWELAPQHRRLTFLGYPLADTFHQPQMLIYPVQDYLVVDPSIGDRLATLQQMLLMKSTEHLPQPLPFFPSWNAGQVIATQVKYVDFKNGVGVRYLTQYGQDVYPINSQAMFYTFQGLTSDSKWLISAVLPVANPILPDPETVLQDSGFYDNYTNYLEEMKKQLSEQPDSSFQPDLSVLDALIRSFEVK